MKCEHCSGYGVIDCTECGGSNQFNKDGEIVLCAACGQDGNAPGQLCCPHCNGSGDEDEEEVDED